jgi:hypothetical protein
MLAALATSFASIRKDRRLANASPVVARARVDARLPEADPSSSSSSSSSVPTPSRRVAAVALALAAIPAPRVSAADDASCSSCEGAVDGTLGRCEGFARDACRSTFDDRPPYFAAPWEFGRDVADTREALDAIRRALVAEDGTIEDDLPDVGYLRAAFRDGVVLEFLARGEDDLVCEVRGTIRGGGGVGPIPSLGGSAPEKRLIRVRRRLGWAEVPVLRNRTPKVLGYFETPFDDFGPVPPPTMDYEGMRGDALSDPLL